MIVSAAEMRALEEAAFARGVTAEALMEQAGQRSAEAVMDFFPQRGVVVAVFGKGNNGGDALVAARFLGAAGWEVHVVPAFPEAQWNDLARKKFDECGLAEQHPVGGLDAAILGRVRRTGPIVLLDGLLGVGARGDLRGPLAEATRALNAWRERAAAQVFALDLPTGLDADSGQPGADCVQADFTLTIGTTKRGLVADSAAGHVGRLIVVPLDALKVDPGQDEAATPANLAPIWPRRPFDMHKGDCGRVSIVAGSVGMIGAALLSSEACVRAGAGLVCLFVRHDAYEIAAAAAAPEVMVKGVSSYAEVSEIPFDVLALGPGLGQDHADEILGLIRETAKPMVIDADGLNILSRDLSALAAPPAPRLLTPHPGEMQRLMPAARDLSRLETVRHFTSQLPITLLLKGMRTLIGERGRPFSYNSTGHPGMASGGMGDVLTGVCAALLGQKLSTYDAARLGAWLCGRAAEIAIHHGPDSEESLCARSIIAQLGRAFGAVKRGWV